MLNRSIKYIYLVILFVILTSQVISLFGMNYENEIHEWRILKTLHFNIYYTDPVVDIALYCSNIAEENYIYVSDYLHHELNNVIDVIIYDPGMTDCKSNFIQFKKKNNICQYQDSFDNNFFISFKGSYSDIRTELTHKLVHCFQYEILFDESPWSSYSYNLLSDYPEFIVEGMAEYIASGYNEFSDIAMRDIINSASYTYLMDIRLFDSVRNDSIPEVEKSFYYFLDRNYSRQKVREILWNSIIYDLCKAIELTLKANPDEINSKWIDFYKERYSHFLSNDYYSNDEQYLHLNNNDEARLNSVLSVIDENNVYFLSVKNNYYEINKSNITGRENKSVLKNNLRKNISDLKDIVFSSDYPSISVDSGKAAYIKSSGQREGIALIDIRSGEIIEEIKLPFKKIVDLSISPDGKNIVFVGISNSSSDIYIYNIIKKTINRITDDLFSERYPRMSADNYFLVYCSNKNLKNDPESDEYKLVKYDLNDKKQIIIASEKNNIHPDISYDGENILYITNASGIYNTYYYNNETDKNIRITNLPSGTFFPRWFPDGKGIVYSSFNKNRLNIYTKGIDNKNNSQMYNHKIPEYQKVKYPASYFDIKDSVLIDYKNENSSIINSYASGNSFENNHLLSAGLQLTDYLNVYEFSLESDIHNIEEENYVNINIEYDYLKYYTDFGFGFFYRTNPLYACNLYYSDYLCGQLKAYYRACNSKEYGSYMLINYPVFKNVLIGLKVSSAKNKDIEMLFKDNRNDPHSNQISATLSYNNLIIERSLPVSGTKFEINYSNSFDITGDDYLFRVININFIKALNLWNRLFLTVNGEWGRVIGRDRSQFAYYLGGINTIRGHDLFQYNGNNAYLLQTEIRFLIFKRLFFSRFYPLKLKNLSLVLFFDLGSAWDEEYDQFKEDGEFDDMKAGTGAGLRIQAFDHLVFKLDAAWPYFYKSFGNNQIILGFDFNY